MNSEPQYRTNRLPRYVLGGLLAAGLLTAACGNGNAEPLFCHTVTIGDGETSSTSDALLFSLESAAGRDDIDTLTGINETYTFANRELLEKHEIYSFVMPGDMFEYCVTADDEVTYVDGSAVANEQ